MAMGAAPAHVFFPTAVPVQPLLLPAATPAAAAAGDGRRGGGRRRRSRPLPPATKTSLPTTSNDDLDVRHQKLITDVRKTFLGWRRSGRETMATVDNLKRLCIDHYFEEEINSAMTATSTCMDLLHSNDLLDATLSFRLMRETGHDVSADDVLRRFTNGAGEFSLALSRDTMGLLSLHDMSQLDIGGEALLYKAKEFSRKHLASVISHTAEQGLSKYVRQSLEHPYHLSLMQYKARHHLSYLQSLPNNRSTAAMELAVAEFQLNKTLHQMELKEIKRWWMNLGLAQEIPVSRDQVLKWYTWSMTILQGSSFSRYRVEITKIISIAYVVDDIFDVVGTLEELSLFTEAIKMWDVAAADSLPCYMRSCYKGLYTATNEMADMAEKEHGLNPIDHLRKAWAVLFDGFMVEAKWLANDQVPSADEYLRNGVITSGVPLAFVHILFLLGQHHAAIGNAAELSDSIPPAITSVSKILRLWDDMGSSKDEAQGGLDGSYRELYLKENPGASAGDAEEHMRRMIAREWQELNRECFSRRTFSSCFAQACLNAARMVSVMYMYDKEQKLPVLEDYMRMLLL